MTNNESFKRKLIPQERAILRFPNANIGITVKIKGAISEKDLKEALKKVKRKYLNLNLRVVIDENHDIWFTSENVPEIDFKKILRTSDKQWIKVYLDEHKKAFEIEKGPLARVILLKSKDCSDLIIISHHAISNALSLIRLAHDIFTYMTNKNLKVKKVNYPPLPIPDNFPVKNTGLFTRLAIIFINKIWKSKEIIFDKEYYQLIHKSYWDNVTYNILIKDFSKKETEHIVKKCKENNVTVTSALTTAFIAARKNIFEKSEKTNKKQRFDITVDLDNYLTKPVENAFGFYVGELHFKHLYNSKKSFFHNVSIINERLKKRLKSDEIYKEILNQFNLTPTLIDALPIIYHWELVPPYHIKYKKLVEFSYKRKLINYIFKKFNSYKPEIAVSNAGKSKLKNKYNSFEIDRIYILPSASTEIELTISIATSSGKMSVTLNNMKEKIDEEDVKKILDKTIKLLNLDEVCK